MNIQSSTYNLNLLNRANETSNNSRAATTNAAQASEITRVSPIQQNALSQTQPSLNKTVQQEQKPEVLHNDHVQQHKTIQPYLDTMSLARQTERDHLHQVLGVDLFA